MKEASVVSASEVIFENLRVRFEPEYGCVWASMRYPSRPCMSRGLLSDLAHGQVLIRDAARAGYEAGDEGRLRYQILSSELPGVFNLGGDLAYFISLIREGDQDGLFQYAKTCIEILYPSYTGYGLPFTSIALVQGEALGGGFEAALAAKIVVAEEGSTFGFPESLFGLFPGMGAFTFLARRLSPAMAKRIITSGKVYTAEELYDLGVVDVLTESGKGAAAIYQYIVHQHSRSQGFYGLDKVMDRFNPVSYDELMEVVEIWVDNALQLSEKNLRLMEYLLRAQSRRWSDGRQDQQQVALSAVG